MCIFAFRGSLLVVARWRKELSSQRERERERGGGGSDNVYVITEQAHDVPQACEEFLYECVAVSQ
jgi:hypothetical protein